MAETNRRYGELVRGVFKILLPHPDGLPARTVMTELGESVPPTEFEAAPYPRRPEVRRYEKTVRFATIGAVKAGWLVKDKAQWTLTDEGRKAYEEFREPEKFMKEALRLYRHRMSEQPELGQEGPESEDVPTETATTLEEAKEDAWTEIEDYLGKMLPFVFQDLVVGLLRGMGYYIGWIAPPNAADGGIDVIAHTDRLGIAGPRVKVQVKHQTAKTTSPELQAFLAVLGDGDRGLFISKAGFTSDAAKLARGQENRRVTLIDLERLFDLWVEYYKEIPESDRQLLPLTHVHFLTPPV